MRKMFFAAALALSASAMPAKAADPATLSCVITTMPAAERKAMMDGGGKVALGEAKALPASATAALATAAQTCKAKHGWSDAATTAAQTYSLAQTAYVGAVMAADTLGIKEGPFLAALASLTEEQRQGILKQDMEALNAFVAALTANGIDVNDEKKGVLVGVMAAFWMLSDGNKTAFASA